MTKVKSSMSHPPWAKAYNLEGNTKYRWKTERPQDFPKKGVSCACCVPSSAPLVANRHNFFCVQKSVVTALSYFDLIEFGQIAVFLRGFEVWDCSLRYSLFFGGRCKMLRMKGILRFMGRFWVFPDHEICLWGRHGQYENWSQRLLEHFPRVHYPVMVVGTSHGRVDVEWNLKKSALSQKSTFSSPWLHRSPGWSSTGRHRIRD